MKKFVKGLGILTLLAILVGAIVVGIIYQQHRVRNLSFYEGTVQELKDCNTVTVTNDWIVYQSDDFIKKSSDEVATKTTVGEVYCNLHKCELIKASYFTETKSFSKLKISKTITVTDDSNSTEKIYFLVGSYYVTSPDTPVVSDSDSSQEIVEEG